MEYADAPIYIVHGDDVEGSKTFTATDGSGDSVVIAEVSDGYTINGTKLYSASKVDTLIAGVKSWATGQFQPKQ